MIGTILAWLGPALLIGYLLGWSSRRRYTLWLMDREIKRQPFGDRRWVMADLVKDLNEIRALLREAAAYIQLDRDCEYECTTTAEGAFMDSDDEASIRETDALLGRIRGALE